MRSVDDQIEIIAQIICYDWIDVLRGIEPSFEDGDSFLRSVKTGERRGGEADSVIFCLKKWIEQNPRDACNLLSAVCSAAEAADRKDLAEKLAAKFQNFPNMLDNVRFSKDLQLRVLINICSNIDRALTMSSDFSSLRAEASRGSERR